MVWKTLRFIGGLVVGLGLSAASGADTPIHFGGVPAELAISEVSPHTLRVQLLPLDDNEHTLEPVPSTVLVPFPSTEKLRARSLLAVKELEAGRLRLTVRPRPL